MRAFIAIKLPKEIKTALACLQKNLKPSGADVKWVEPEDIHLTLKFLGEIPPEQEQQISIALEGITSGLPSFKISLGNLGAFPTKIKPRVIWAGIHEGTDQIQTITSMLNNSLGPLGIANEERPFSAHLTLGRVRSTMNIEKLSRLIEGTKIIEADKRKEFRVERIIFYKSTLTQREPVYTPLRIFNLITT